MVGFKEPPQLPVTAQATEEARKRKLKEEREKEKAALVGVDVNDFED